MIEELDDIVEEIANYAGIYGEDRSGFTCDLANRIMDAVALPAQPTDTSVRERIALDIMCAWLGNPEVFWDDGEGSDPESEYYARIAKHAFVAADAFLSLRDPGSTASSDRLEDDKGSGKTGQSRKSPGAQRARRKTK